MNIKQRIILDDYTSTTFLVEKGDIFITPGSMHVNVSLQCQWTNKQSHVFLIYFCNGISVNSKNKKKKI